MKEDKSKFQNLMEEMNFSHDWVKSSYFYSLLLEQLDPDSGSKILNNIKRALGSGDNLKMRMVVIGLGNIQFNFASKFYLAFALLLKDHLLASIPVIDHIDIDVYETNPHPAEFSAMEALGCRLIPVSADWAMRIDEPTLLLMPFTRFDILGHLLEHNWCPSCLNRIVLLGCSLREKATDFDEKVLKVNEYFELTESKLTFSMDKLRYIWAIKEYTQEYEIMETLEGSHEVYKPEKMFYNLSWQFFCILQDVNMESILPRIPSPLNCVEQIHSIFRLDKEDVDEARQLRREVEIAMKELKESEFYSNVCAQMKDDSKLRDGILRRLGEAEEVQMVLYGLGSLEFQFKPHFQLALALLLRQDMRDILKIGEIQAFDPEFTPVDASVLKSFGCTALTTDELGRRRVEKPIIFYTTFVYIPVMANLLEANWCFSQLQKIVWLANSLTDASLVPDYDADDPDYIPELKKLELIERKRYLAALKGYTTEFPLEVGKWSIFNQFAWHLFDIGPEADLDAALASFPLIDKIRIDEESMEPYYILDSVSDKRNTEEDFVSFLFNKTARFEKYHSMEFINNHIPPCQQKHRFDDWHDSRWPSRYRRSSLPPPTGWIKLNFTGGSHWSGGVFSNERGEEVLSYDGSLEHEDTTAAQVTALVQGLRFCLQHFDISNLKLVVESDAISVIRWAKYFNPPPVRFRQQISESLLILANISDCVIYHVYEEANAKAIEVAKCGSSAMALASCLAITE